MEFLIGILFGFFIGFIMALIIASVKIANLEADLEGAWKIIETLINNEEEDESNLY